MHACFLYMSLSSQVDCGLQSQQCNQTLIEGGVISTLCQLMLMDLWGFVYHDLGGMLILSNYANVSSLFISLMYDLLIFLVLILCFLLTHRIM